MSYVRFQPSRCVHSSLTNFSTMSRVFFARSLTNGLAIMVILFEALGCGIDDTTKGSENSFFSRCSLYGTNISKVVESK